MNRVLTAGTILLVNATLVTGCATKGQLRRVEAELAAERSERMAAEQALRADVNGVRTDLDALRRDLETLRSEFGAQITSLQGDLQFAMPVHFGFDRAEIEPSAHAALDRFASVVQRHYAGSHLTVEGFADPAGSEAYNRQLSQRRAQAVEGYLLQKGISDSLVRAVGYGETRLVVPGAAAAEPGAQLNRRVVFVIEGGAELPAMPQPTPSGEAT
jgi:peptidoglycan-associated lipoprotein